MAKNVKTELVSRNMSRITLHITCYATYHVTYGLFGVGNAANFRSLQPAAAENAFSRGSIRLLQKGLRRAQLQVLTPPGKVRGFKSGRRPKISPGAPPFPPLLQKTENTVNYGVLSDLSAKSPS